MTPEQLIDLVTISKEMTDRYKKILDLTPIGCPHLKELAHSCIIFTSFVAHMAERYGEIK